MGYKEGSVYSPMKDGAVEFSDIDYTETWLGLEDCVKAGLVKSIGLSNFNSEQIERILSVATIKPVANQVECNPNINQKKLRAFCEERDIVIIAYCPLGKAAEARQRADLPVATMEDSKVIQIAKKHKKTAAQVCLRYLVSYYFNGILKNPTKCTIVF